MSVRLLVADDHEVIRTGLKSLLADSDIEVVAEAATGKEAVEEAEKAKPDVILLDIEMPRIGRSLPKTLTEDEVDALLSAHPEHAAAVHGQLARLDRLGFLRTRAAGSPGEVRSALVGPVEQTRTSTELFDHPFIYMIEPGALEFREPEIEALRRYCLNGGFMMVDDFWGEDEWHNFETEMRRVFPDRKIKDVPLEHPIFHIVYDLKEKPQIPSISRLTSFQSISGSSSTWVKPKRVQCAARRGAISR